MTSELAAVEELLVRVLPDPMGFAERILGELMERLATPAPSGRPTVLSDLGTSRPTAEPGGPSDPVPPDPPTSAHTATMTADPSPDDVARAGVEALADRVLLLAAALGACDCWGDHADCPDCSGRGRPGWVPPDPQLYQELVAPAARRAGPPAESRPHPDAGSPTEPGLHPHSDPEGDPHEHLLG